MDYNKEILLVDFDQINGRTDLKKFKDQQKINFERMKKEYQSTRMVTEIEERLSEHNSQRMSTTYLSSTNGKKQKAYLDNDPNKTHDRIRNRKKYIDDAEAQDRYMKKIKIKRKSHDVESVKTYERDLVDIIANTGEQVESSNSG